MKMPRQRSYPVNPYAEQIIELYQQGLSYKEIHERLPISYPVVKYQLVKNKIPLRPIKPRECEEVYGWKGDQASHNSIHRWVRKRLPKPELCEKCQIEPPRDLANIRNHPNPETYTRDLKNWRWLCRRCHIREDGRIETNLTYNKRKVTVE